MDNTLLNLLIQRQMNQAQDPNMAPAPTSPSTNPTLTAPGLPGSGSGLMNAMPSIANTLANIPTKPSWMNFIKQPAPPQPGPGQPPTLPQGIQLGGNHTAPPIPPTSVQAGPSTPSSPVPPNIHARVPQQAKRWDNANQIANAYKNGWNPNPVLLRAQLGNK